MRGTHRDGKVQNGRLMTVDEVAHGLPLGECHRGCQALHALHSQPAIPQRLLVVAARPRRELLHAEGACEASANVLHVAR